MADKKRKSCIKGGRGCAAARQVYVPATAEGRRPPGRLLMCGTLCAAPGFSFQFCQSCRYDSYWPGDETCRVYTVGQGVRIGTASSVHCLQSPHVTLRAARGPLGVALWDESSHKSGPPVRRPLPARAHKDAPATKTSTVQKIQICLKRRPLRRMMDILA